MARLLLIIAIAAVGWYLYRRLVVKPGTQGPATPPAAPSGTDTITRCAHCGVHVPEQSGVHFQSQFFCSPDHLNEYLRQQGKN